MRGSNTLYRSLLAIEPPQTNGTGKRVYLDQRDDALAYRYYYYAELKQLGYERSLSILEREFYLSQRAVILRLEQRTGLIKQAVRERVRVADLRGLFPHYNWK